jgi:hypothetical protein
MAAVDFLLVDLRRAVFLFAGLRAEVRFFAVDFFAVDLRRVVLRRVALRAVVFLFAADLRPAVFLFAVFRFLVAAPFFAAVERLALFRFLVAAAFFAAVERLALFRFVDFLAVDFFLAGDMVTPFPLCQDAMRFRRRRSRSLIPPHTPYRSSRRSA